MDIMFYRRYSIDDLSLMTLGKTNPVGKNLGAV